MNNISQCHRNGKTKKHFIQICAEGAEGNKIEIFSTAPHFNTVRGKEKTEVA